MDPAKLKVVDLRAQLSQRGLDSKGNKAVLVERLRKALEEESEGSNKKLVQNTVEDEMSSEKPVQAPRTPARSSRSSSMTPTKISTRSTLKQPITPTGKQNIPDKTQDTEKSKDVLNIVPEKVDEQPNTDEKDQATSLSEKSQSTEELSEKAPTEMKEEAPPLEEVKEKQEDTNENENDDAKISEDSQTLESEELPQNTESSIEEPVKEADQSIDQSCKSPVDSEEKLDSLKKQKDDNDQQDLDLSKQEEEEENVVKTTEKHTEQPIESIQEDTQSMQQSKDETEETTGKETTLEEKDARITEVKTEGEEPMEIANTEETDKTSQDSTGAETEVGTKEDEQKQPELDELENEENDQCSMDTKEKDDQRSMEAQPEEELNNKNDTVMADAPDTEMVEVKNESKKEWDAERTDRKRKRSPSPGSEDRSTLTSTPIMENEPEFDDSALVLSWYDSDLNLNIEKDKFLSASPVHTDGFCYIWAGVRATYGFTSGKVYYEVKISEKCPIDVQEEKEEEYLHSLRVGWSVSRSNLQLGEERLSYGYSSSGKKCTNNKFEDYGLYFGVNDIIGCYADMTPENDVILSYTVNGKDAGIAFVVSKEELGGNALFPHILSKNCTFSCNFGQEDPWSEEIPKEFVPVGKVEPTDRVPGPRGPEKKKDCEVLMMCGLPGSGKTVWATKYAAEHPEKMYNILGLSVVADKMKNMGQPRKQNYPLIDKCTRTLNKLLEMACSRRRNYILDQTNVYPSAQRRKMKNFSGYQRKAIVVVPTDEEYKSRASKHEAIDGKAVPDSTIMEMKANFSAPEVGESFEEVEWVELDREEGKKLIEKYNKEGKEAGASQNQVNKRPRYEKPAESSKDSRDSRSSRDGNRDSRDHRDRRSSYSERSRSSSWRSNNNSGGWREKSQRGHMRHGGGGGSGGGGGGYGSPGGWRGARNLPLPPAHRGGDRRGGSSDRRGNDRVRSSGQRQGGWGPASGYQGSQQQSGWSQGSSWSSSGQSQGGWGQGGWGQQQWGSNWKGYGQGAYGQSNYNQQAYGNGNWNSWNQQYYNQYWNQQQQTGQTTAAGGQAVSTTQNEIETTPANTEASYDYSEGGWQGYDQTYSSYPTENTTASIQTHRHK